MADKTDRAQPSVSERLGGARLWGNFDTSSKTVDGRFGEGLAVEVLAHCRRHLRGVWLR